MAIAFLRYEDKNIENRPSVAFPDSLGELDTTSRPVGFSRVSDMGQAEINARDFSGRAGGLQVVGAYHLMSA